MARVLTEFGELVATTDTGLEVTFRPCFANIAAIGSPEYIVETFAAVHGADFDALMAAHDVLMACSEGRAEPLLGYAVQSSVASKVGPSGAVYAPSLYKVGAMSAQDMLVLARHLMTHGIIGKAKPAKGGKSGDYSNKFSASEYISAAMIHFGMSREDAERLSMTQFQQMLYMKFPELNKADKYPSKVEYEQQKAAIFAKRAERERAANG